VIHYYHMWVDSPHWQVLAQEHLDALRAAAFPGEIRLGLVGTLGNRALARAHPLVAAGNICAEASRGFEQVTLAAIRDEIQGMPDSEAVFYAHDKGSYHGSLSSIDANRRWVMDMHDTLVRQWPACAQGLEMNACDVVALHWGTVGAPDDVAQGVGGQGYPVGNFWWARADYLRTLPELNWTHRAFAETWVGSGLTMPRVNAVWAGMPNYDPLSRNASSYMRLNEFQ
jgi:hypothetical protein